MKQCVPYAHLHLEILIYRSPCSKQYLQGNNKFCHDCEMFNGTGTLRVIKEDPQGLRITSVQKRSAIFLYSRSSNVVHLPPPRRMRSNRRHSSTRSNNTLQVTVQLSQCTPCSLCIGSCQTLSVCHLAGGRRARGVL